MKKILIAAAIACTAAISQAATVTWAATPVDVLASSGAKTITSAWGFDTKDLTQSAFIALFAENDKSWQTIGAQGGYEDSMAWGEMKNSYENGAPVNAWAAFLDDKGNVLVSDTVSVFVGGAGQDPAPFLDTTNSTLAGLYNAADGFKSAGWYSVQQQPIDTPEPTSGLMLLLGMAGLALRRRRA